MPRENPSKVSPSEFKLLAKLDSLYKALTLTAVAPVVLPSESIDRDLSSILHRGRKDKRDKVGTFSHQYWDTHNHESYAFSVMKERISSAKDIRAHDRLHSEFDDNFKRISRAVRDADGVELYNSVRPLCRKVNEYNSLVLEHSKSCPYTFLYYPTCTEGHFFYIPKTGFNPVSSSFNPDQSFDGAGLELDMIGTLLEECPAEHLNTYDLRFPDNPHMLSSNIRTNWNLLERAGFSWKRK